MLLFCLLVAFICSLLLHLCEHNTLYGFRICRCMSRVVLVEGAACWVRYSFVRYAKHAHNQPTRPRSTADRRAWLLGNREHSQVHIHVTRPAAKSHKTTKSETRKRGPHESYHQRTHHQRTAKANAPRHTMSCHSHVVRTGVWTLHPTSRCPSHQRRTLGPRLGAWTAP